MNCSQCSGLIMEPGKSYGYAGKVCGCLPPIYPSYPTHDRSFNELCDTFKVTPAERIKLVEHLKLIRNIQLDKLKEPS